MPILGRRDFLKLASLVSGTVALSKFAPRSLATNSSPNVIVFVFDAMSAGNLSIYGYPRDTTPNFERFARHATVYHAHHSAGNFTSPGTASLLTGMYPWTHRAINISGLIERDLTDRNIFRLIGKEHHRFAYSQNLWPNYFFGQFQGDIETVLPPQAFSTVSHIFGSGLPADENAAYRTFDDFLFQDGQPPASLVYGLLDRVMERREVAFAETSEYPSGLPRTGNYPIFFKLNEVFDGLYSTIGKLSAPYFAYFHLWSPHAPYRPSLKYDNLFMKDKLSPAPKPDHRFGDHISKVTLNNRRLNYDQYIANLDEEFGQLVDRLQKSGTLDQSYIVITSDHGESFERGVEGHVTPLLYEPVIHIPLIVSAPGQTTRKDVHTPTNSIDVLPTLLNLIGKEKPDWSEGEVLPGLGGSDDPSRSTFSVEAKTNPAYKPLTKATVAMRKENYKLIYYTGREAEDSFELYDLDSDYEEMHDLYPKAPAIAKTLKEELLDKFHAGDAKYRRS